MLDLISTVRLTDDACIRILAALSEMIRGVEAAGDRPSSVRHLRDIHDRIRRGQDRGCISLETLHDARRAGIAWGGCSDSPAFVQPAAAALRDMLDR